MSKVLKKVIGSIADHKGSPPTTRAMREINDTLNFLQSDSFPCVGAKASLVQNGIEFSVYDDFKNSEADTSLYFDLQEYITRLRPDDARVQSFVAIFKEPTDLNEEDFETVLWERLKGLHSMNTGLDVPWSPKVSADPNNPHFSMSVAGHPFFVVGMHPNSSRLARRSPYTMMVFNSNVQFDKLKEDGRYEKLQAVIRQNEKALQGTINPNLADFGESSEARQYSGRPVTADWSCPVNFNGDEKK
jgi:FPC/CPF motif-containing protein YcgG